MLGRLLNLNFLWLDPWWMQPFHNWRSMTTFDLVMTGKNLWFPWNLRFLLTLFNLYFLYLELNLLEVFVFFVQPSNFGIIKLIVAGIDIVLALIFVLNWLVRAFYFIRFIFLGSTWVLNWQAVIVLFRALIGLVFTWRFFKFHEGSSFNDFLFVFVYE